MTTILTIIHILVSFFLVIIVLLQHGKGADIGATFGGSSQTVFGTEGPLPLLNKITTAAAVLFMVTSISLAYYSAQASRSTLMRGTRPPVTAPEQQPGPATVPLMPSVPGSDQPATFPAAPEGNQ
jgi:preprotein translocase subunit SecG